jgi:aldose 1-epimerase
VAGTDLDFRFGAPIGAARLDTAYDDLERDDDGLARVRLTPGWRGARGAGGGAGVEGLELWMDPGFTHVMVYSGDTLAEPARRRQGLAVEPMTCAPNMLRSGDGLRVIEEGQTFEAAWGLRAFRFE